MAEMTLEHPTHPLGSDARVLLVSVFGPFAQDDAYGSREINPMELYHNQVTRVQAGFSMRTFQRSWGLMLIQANLKAACTLLDFPDLARFIEELKTRQYDVIGISSIMTNLQKVRKMVRLIGKHQPNAKVVIGGHIANISELTKWTGADYIAKGDGVQWMRKFLGEDENQPVKHPQILGNIGTRIMGVNLRNHAGDHCATLIPSVGCPIGCNFCSTSAMFGGKGKSVQFYQTGEQLFELMSTLETNLKVKSFFVMDENFLLDKKRALGLLELIEKHNKAWSLYVFSSANILQKYTIDQLVSLGVSWVWLGLEGKGSKYPKLAGTDPYQLIRDLQSHGIRVLGSSIIGLEEHTPENIGQVIEDAIGHGSDFHQFMLYTPIPGTPLYAEHEANSTLRSFTEVPVADTHGQLTFNYQHPHIKDGEEGKYLLQAFERDFEINGPSVVRIARTTLQGWQRYKNHPDPRIRERFAHEASNLPIHYAGVLWASRHRYRNEPHRKQLIDRILNEFHAEFGWKSRLAAPLIGRYLYRTLRREEKRLENGWTYEPPTFYETNRSNESGHATFVDGLKCTPDNMQTR
ncbi:MAG: cobalamin-dependent protein [Lysobacterales bacterium]